VSELSEMKPNLVDRTCKQGRKQIKNSENTQTKHNPEKANMQDTA